MQLVAASKMRRAQDIDKASTPYSHAASELLTYLASQGVTRDHPLFVQRKVDTRLLIVISADKGLVGAYNANVIKLAKQLIKEKYNTQSGKGNVTIWSIGKKGYEHFAKNNYKVTDTHKDIFLNLTFDNVQKASQAAIEGFKNREFDAVEIIYSEFKNAATQRFVAEPFLPIPKSQNTNNAVKADFIFDPSKEELIAELMPKILNTQLYKAVLDANASEHGARMTAMDKASENANELLRNLKISYNRARQAAITTELTEIVSGAAALQG